MTLQSKEFKRKKKRCCFVLQHSLANIWEHNRPTCESCCFINAGSILMVLRGFMFSGLGDITGELLHAHHVSGDSPFHSEPAFNIRAQWRISWPAPGPGSGSGSTGSLPPHREEGRQDGKGDEEGGEWSREWEGWNKSETDACTRVIQHFETELGPNPTISPFIFPSCSYSIFPRLGSTYHCMAELPTPVYKDSWPAVINMCVDTPGNFPAAFPTGGEGLPRTLLIRDIMWNSEICFVITLLFDASGTFYFTRTVQKTDHRVIWQMEHRPRPKSHCLAEGAVRHMTLKNREHSWEMKHEIGGMQLLRNLGVFQLMLSRMGKRGGREAVQTEHTAAPNEKTWDKLLWLLKCKAWTSVYVHTSLTSRRAL